MPSIADIVSNALTQSTASPLVGITQQKQAETMVAADAKRAQLAGMPSVADLQNLAVQRSNPRFVNRALPVASEMEGDLATLTAPQLIAKYGDQAFTLMGRGLDASSAYQNRLDAPRSTFNEVTDPAVDVGSGFLNSLASIGLMGVGTVAPQAAAQGAELLGQGNQWVGDHLQSTVLRNARSKYAADQALSDVMNQDTQARDQTSGDGAFLSGLKRIGRDATDAVINAGTNGPVLESGVASGVGSMLAVAPIGKALSVAGKAVPLLAKAAQGLEGLGPVGKYLAEHGQTMGAIGLMEGGGAYQQTAAQVMGTSHEDLLATSPEYARRTAAGEDPAAVKADLANKAGLEAAAVQGPIAAATGALVAPLEEAPFRLRAGGEALWNMGKEGLEETINSGTGQLAQNLGVQQQVAPSQDLVQGVGEQAGLGGLYAIGSAGAVEAPSLARAGVVGGAKLAGQTFAAYAKAGSSLLGDLAEQRAAQQASQQETAATQAQSDAVAQAPQLAAQLKEAAAASEQSPAAMVGQHQAIDKLVGLATFDPAETAQEPPIVQWATQGAHDRFQAMRQVAALAADEQTPPAERAQLGAYLQRAWQAAQSSIAQLHEVARRDVPDDHPALNTLHAFVDTFHHLNEHPLIQQGLEGARIGAQDLAGVTAGLENPETAQHVADAVTQLAVQAPEKLNPEVADLIRQQAKVGIIQLTPAQQSVLQSAQALAAAHQALSTGEQQGSDKVSGEVIDQGGKVGLGAQGHVKAVAQAVQAGDHSLARELMTNFGLFAEHLNRKVEALNQSGETGKPASYSALRSMYDREMGVDARRADTQVLHMHDEGSIKYAQRVAREAQAVTELHNQMLKAYPTIENQTKITPVKLAIDPKLERHSADLVVKKPAPAPVQLVEPAKAVEQPVEKVSTIPIENKPISTELKIDGRPYSEMTDQDIENYDMRRVERRSEDEVLNDMGERISPKDFVSNLDKNQVAGVIDPRGRLWLITNTRDYGDNPDAGAHGALAQALSLATRNWEAMSDYIKVTAYGGQISTAQVDDAVAMTTKQETTVKALKTRALHEGKQYIGLLEKVPVKESVTELVQAGSQSTTPEPTVEAPVEPEAPKTVKAAYPDLVGADRGLNWFHKALAFAKGGSGSRLTAAEHPINFVLDALASAQTFTAALDGKPLEHKLNDALLGDWAAFVGETLEPLHAVLERRLADFLAKESKGAFGTVGKNLQNAEQMLNPVTNWLQGRVINLVQPQADSGFAYHPQLLQAAMLAGLHWLVTSGSRPAQAMDEERIGKILGVDPLAVPEEAMQFFQTGVWDTLAIRQMADAIERFWGVRQVRDAPIGYSRGIAEAMAGEILEAMLNEAGGIGLLAKHSADFEGKTYIQLGLAPSEDDGLVETLQALSAFPDALEQLAVKEPQPTRYIGTPPQKVADTQQRNALVQNSPKQKEILQRKQNVEHRINPPMVSFLETIGQNMALALFGAGDLSTRTLNKNHRVSLEGQNITTAGAYNELMNTVAELRNKAAAAGVKPQHLPIYYAFNFARNGRLMMQGAYSPQSSKLVREAILPTWSTLNLDDPKHLTAFRLAQAQGLGIKVHKLSADAALAKLDERLAALKPARDLLGSFLKSGKFSEVQVGELQTAFQDAGVELTPAALHALLEQVRSQGQTQIETGLYLEADGVTDGPINALWHLATGGFNDRWVELIAKGGAFFGSVKTTLADHVAQGGPAAKDLYEVSSDGTLGAVNQHLSDLKIAAPAAYSQAVKVMSLLNRLLGPDLEFDPKTGQLTMMDRGVAKNPLTVTVYGSGADGIANKVTDTLVRAFYEKLSDALEGRASADDAALLKGLVGHLAATQAVVYQDKASGRTQAFIKALDTGEFKGRGDEDLTLNPAQLKALQANIREYFVRPLQASIEHTMGDTLQGRTVLQKAVQVQSIWLEHAFRDAVAAKLAEKKAADPTFKNEQFLSQAELEAIQKDLEPYAPLVKLAGLSLYMADSDASDVVNLGVDRPIRGFGAATTGHMRATPEIVGPSDAGVRGIPYTVIGFGDALMVQLLNRMTQAPQGTLDVFDGIHLKLDTLFDDAATVNQAVHEGWGHNPLGAVNAMFQAFLGKIDLQQLTPAQVDDLKRVFFSAKDAPGKTQADLIGAIRGLQLDFAHGALAAEARHQALAQVQMSVDHMASAGTPYQQRKGLDLAGKTAAEIAVELNRLYISALAKLSGEPEAKAPAKPEPSEVLGQTELGKFVTGLKLPIEQRSIVRQALRSLSGGWEVIRGALAANLEHAQAAGLSAAALSALQTGQGMSDPLSRKLYINTDVAHDPVETLVHELIHAALTEKLMAYADDPNSLTAEVRASVATIQTLMQQWLTIEPGSAEHEAALRQIQGELNNPQRLSKFNQAVAMDEFIAWSLSNRELIKQAQQTKVENPAARVAKKVLDYVWRLIRGRGDVTPARSDLFTTLRWHAAVVMTGPAPLQARALDVARGQHPLYGVNDRLSRLDLTWNQKVALHLAEQADPGLAKLSFAAEAKRVGDQVADLFHQHGWPMTPQERILFGLIATSFGALNKLHPVALSQSQVLFDHVVKALQASPDRLYDPAIVDPQAQHYDADQKLNALLGTYGVVEDQAGRSSRLPAFMALAAVHEGFREVLRELPLPKTAGLSDGHTFDQKAENLANQAFDALAQQLSGQGRGQSHVQGAIDALTAKLADTVEQREGLFFQLQDPVTQALGAVGAGINAANEALRETMQTVSGKTIERIRARQAQLKSDGLEHTVLEAAKLLVAAVNDTEGPAAAEGMVQLANTLKLWDPIHRLIGDLIGRTESNAPVTDLIKQVRFYVQQLRQQFREHLPVKLANEFSRALTKDEWTHLNTAFGKTDLAALKGYFTLDQMLNLFTNHKVVTREVQTLETSIQAELNSPKDWALLQAKAQQLARYMMTGETGYHLLRNAEALAKGFRGQTGAPLEASRDLVQDVDRLVSLYAIQQLSPQALIAVRPLVLQERAGLTFLTHYLVGQRVDEMTKVQATDEARLNHYKGYIPSEAQKGAQLVVAPLSEHARLLELGFAKVGDYQASEHEKQNAADQYERRGYYFAPLGKAPFVQGIMQNVHATASGVDPKTGFSYGPMTAGRIVHPKAVAQLARVNRSGSAKQGSQLLPVFDEQMHIVAYERSIDPKMDAKLQRNTHLAQNIGVWRGRQAEEGLAGEHNRQLVQALAQVWNEAKTGLRKSEFVNLLDPKLKTQDPVVWDAVRLFTPDTLRMIRETFGGDQLMVRRDMIDDAIGYRQASVGDFWTGNTRWNPEAAKAVKDLAIQFAGDNAYKWAVTSERVLQNVVKEIKQNIVIKSVVVPVSNMIANVYQMMSMGISPAMIARLGPQKIAETNQYVQRKMRAIDIEAELRATQGDLVKTRVLQTELATLADANKRMSIWPLIEAGQFSSIHDAGSLEREELTLFQSNLGDYIERLVDKLPPALQTAGKYALVAQDTALFKGLERALEYGDFIAKAITYDHLTQVRQVPADQAMHRIDEAYVNYDRLAGRWRSYAERSGLLWFGNYKIRITKEAVRILRENPLQALLTAFVPTPDFVGNIGSPFSDNLFTQAIDGKLWHSIGPGVGLRGAHMNPWVNLVHGHG